MRPRIEPGRRPDRQAALKQYKGRARYYDTELMLFEPIRAEAIALLQLHPGDRVIDVGCGTGLSFDRLHSRVGKIGRITGVEQCPEMMAQAKEKVAQHRWTNVDLVTAPVATARIDGLADAALFHFTHDILREEAAVANVFAHLKPGARVVAAGLQWAPPWAWPTNGFVMMAALYSTTSLEGLGHPWSRLAPRLENFRVQHTVLGGIYVASGTFDPRHH
ncbi:class I SAM-dependent DNA methyltransferase [Ramlibacter sp. PS4R-6]|uniref:class I SAM-dependent DNA methyltransferase n=1 Tax=Ramlibacter sp. PS4R-6 TaxID=3133438 RepID=UPI0030AA8635